MEGAALVVYDWLLCFSEEVRLVWNWRSRGASCSLVYVLGRYTPLLQLVVAVLEINLISGLVRSLVITSIWLCMDLIIAHCQEVGRFRLNRQISVLECLQRYSCATLEWMRIVAGILSAIAFAGTLLPTISCVMRTQTHDSAHV